MRFTKNLSRHEFECECGCGFNTVDFALVEKLQKTVDHFEFKYGNCSIHITSGCRCKKHNDALRKLYYDTGGKQGALTAENSQHIYGMAADFHITITKRKSRIDPKEVYDWMNSEYGDMVSLGLYSNRVHADTREPGGHRWRTVPK